MGVYTYHQPWQLMFLLQWVKSFSSTFRLVFGDSAMPDLDGVTLSWAEVLVEEGRMKYMAANQKPQPWCAIITLPNVALFHFHLTTDLHCTMDPADLKVPLSFLHGWWTPHLSSFTQHEHCSEGEVGVWGGDRTVTATVFLFFSGNWLQALQLFTVLLNNVVICAYRDRWSLSEGWVMAE